MWRRVAGVVGEHGVGAGERDLGAGEHERRVEVALHGDVGAEAGPGGGDRRAPVEPDHGRPGREHRLEQMVAADAEVDARRVGKRSASVAKTRALCGCTNRR